MSAAAAAAILRRYIVPRATTKNTPHHSFITTSAHTLAPPTTTSDSTTVETAVSILTHHRSNSRWSTLRSLFPHGFTPSQTSQITLQIRNNPHLALLFFLFNSHRRGRSLQSYATIIHILARARLKARARDLIKEAILWDPLGQNGERCDLLKVLVESYGVCGSAPFVFDLLVLCLLDVNKVGPCVRIVQMLRSRGVYVSVSTCNALISSASKCKGCFFGYDLYKELFVCDENVKEGVGGKGLPNVHSFNELMLSFRRNEVLDMVEEVWIEMARCKCSPNSLSYSILMEAYCEEDEIEKAESVWEELRLKGLEPDVVAYNTLIGGYCKVGKVEKGEELYREMVMSGIEGTCVTYQHLVYGYCLAKDADSVLLLFENMRRKGFCPGSCIVDSVVGVVCEEKSATRALEFFTTVMANVDFVARETSYEVLIKGLCCEGNMEEALKLQAQMVGKGFRPNPDLYGAFIDGYTKQGKRELAERLSKEMITA